MLSHLAPELLGLETIPEPPSRVPSSLVPDLEACLAAVRAASAQPGPHYLQLPHQDIQETIKTLTPLLRGTSAGRCHVHSLSRDLGESGLYFCNGKAGAMGRQTRGLLSPLKSQGRCCTCSPIHRNSHPGPRVPLSQLLECSTAGLTACPEGTRSLEDQPGAPGSPPDRHSPSRAPNPLPNTQPPWRARSPAILKCYLPV